jgi:hypothetical protein
MGTLTDLSARAYLDGRRRASYPRGEQLVQDLGGFNGEAARCVADGYIASIRDSELEYIDGHELLRRLRGECGDEKQLFAIGYMAGSRETTATSRPGVDDTPALPQDEIRQVLEWLETHSDRLDSIAVPLVRRALAQGAAHRPAKRLARRNAVAMAAGTCLLVLAGWFANDLGDLATRREAEKDFALSQRAMQITALMLEERRYEKDTFLNISNHDLRSSYAQKWNESRASLNDTLSRTLSLPLDTQDQQTLNQIARDFSAYAEGYSRVVDMIRSGSIRSAAEANERIAAYKDAVHRIERNCAEINERATQRLARTT